MTGGSKGLGAALCNQYLDKGYAVCDLSRTGTQAYSTQIDLSNIDQLLATTPTLFEQLAANTLEDVIFFNNASVNSPIGLTANKEIHDVIENININFTGSIVVMTEFIKAFQAVACPKLLVNMTSGASSYPFYGFSLYCAAKAGIEQFMRVVSLEQKEQPHPIAAINIDPGLVDSGMQEIVRAASKEDFPAVGTFQQFKDDGALRAPAVVADVIEKIIASEWESGSLYKVNEYFSEST